MVDVRDLQEVAWRFLDVRSEFHHLRNLRPEERNALARRIFDQRLAEMRMLAWVLGIEVSAMGELGSATGEAPAVVPDGIEPVERVTLTHIEAMDCWLVEFPPTKIADMTSQYWAALLSADHLRQLVAAIPDAIRNWHTHSRMKGGTKVAILPMPLLVQAHRDVVDVDVPSPA